MKTIGIHVALLLWLLIIKVKTSGKLEIRFIRYGSDGKGSNGYCCDGGGWTWCPDWCDPKFTLCIDRINGSKQCSLYKRATNYIDNHNTVQFGSNIQGTPNPFIIDVPEAMPSTIEITVQVYDYDGASDDHMDTLFGVMNIRAASTKDTAIYRPYILATRTELKIAVRAYCAPDWYGSACERYCNTTPGYSHYTCHYHTGAKMCLEGWKGDNCTQDIDECTETDQKCEHGGTCTNTRGSFECTCVEGIKGTQCEIVTNQCVMEPCLNGGTCNGNETDYECECPVERTGKTCAEKVNFCDNAPCDKGNCTPDLLIATRFKCNCEFSWVGDRCSQSVDIINITLLGEIDHTNRGDLADGLNRLITELGGIPGRVDVKLTTNIQKGRIYTTTDIQLYFALDNGSFLDSVSVERIFESNSAEVISDYLPLTLYPPQDEEKENMENPHNDWNTSQYVSAILPPVGLVLMTVLLLVAFCIRKRRSGKSENRLMTVVAVVPCNRNHNRPGNVQDVSVPPDSSRCLSIQDEDDAAPPETHCDDAAHIHVGTGAMTFPPARSQGDSVSLDHNARHDDAEPPDTHFYDVSHINGASVDMTLDSGRLQGANELLDDNTRQWDLQARRHVTSHTDLPLDVLPHASVHHLTRNYEPFDRCEEEDTEGTVVDDNNVEDISAENPYVHLVVVKR
ncbi:uncharacterized protein [Haliotis asinina]|uniref:uncharacterized protein n=1 Tax=Haliotis asinina TaxID=109174 RepID=UPI003531B584